MKLPFEHRFAAQFHKRRVAENKLGDEVFATAAICDGQIFARVARRNGDSSEEALYGIGFPSDRPAVDPTLEK